MIGIIFKLYNKNDIHTIIEITTKYKDIKEIQIFYSLLYQQKIIYYYSILRYDNDIEYLEKLTKAYSGITKELSRFDFEDSNKFVKHLNKIKIDNNIYSVEEFFGILI